MATFKEMLIISQSYNYSNMNVIKNNEKKETIRKNIYINYLENQGKRRNEVCDKVSHGLSEAAEDSHQLGQ